MENAEDSAKDKRKRQAAENWRKSAIVTYFVRQSHKREREKKQQTPEIKSAKDTARASIVIAVFTVVLATIGWFQWQEVVNSNDGLDRMDRIYRAQSAQLNRQAKETKDLAAQMKAQADQTKEIASISKNEFVDVQRAFVSVTSLDPKVIPNGYTWTLAVQNSGSTNALHLKMRRNCGTPGSLGIKWSDFLDFSKHLLAPQFLEIGPHSTQTLGFCAAIPSAVDGPDRPWIMFGEFTYADIFGEDHLTEFCYQSFGYGSMIPCEGINSRHNCADQDCKEFESTTAPPREKTEKKPN